MDDNDTAVATLEEQQKRIEKELKKRKIAASRTRKEEERRLIAAGEGSSCTVPAASGGHGSSCTSLHTVQSWQSGWRNRTLRTLYIVFWVQVIEVNANYTLRTI